MAYLLSDPIELRSRQLVALEKRLRIRAASKLARLLDPSGYVRGLVLNFVVIPRRSRITWQVENVDIVVAGIANAVVENRRDQYNAIQLDPIVEKRVSERGRSGRPI